MPGNALESSGSRYHSGAGAQLLTVIVCRLLSNARMSFTA